MLHQVVSLVLPSRRSRGLGIPCSATGGLLCLVLVIDSCLYVNSIIASFAIS